MIDFLMSPRGIIIRYIISGCTAAGVDLIALYILTEYVGFVYTTSVVIAFLIAFTASFVLQKYWTFDDNKDKESHKQLIAYFSVQVANLFLNSLLVYLFTEKFGVWYMLSQFITGILIAFSSFLIYRNFIFPKNTNPNTQNSL
ncbi:MAG: GtrA family protein [Candidatus Vogelbacteria bacterium]|nr:GtrA family protein [Candidatus Vogelbacteria bacterium]